MGHWIHCGVPSGWSGSRRVAGLTGVRLGGGRDHAGSLGSLGCSSGSSLVAEFAGIRPWCRRVHPRTLVDARWWSLGSILAARLSWVRPGGRRIH